jgi:hypothetical protein
MNILLIDKRVSRYKDIVAAIDPALAVGVMFDYFEDTFDTMKTRMRALGFTNTNTNTGGPGISVGLIQHNYKSPMFGMLASADVAPVLSVSTRDPELVAWTQFKDFITWCKTEFNTPYFDMMACALYANMDWKYVIDTLTAQTDVTIRASTDDTGAAALGGDWFLESHTGANLKTVYFTEAIEEYRGVLYIYAHDVREYSTKGFETGGVVAWGNSIYGGDSSLVASGLLSGVVAVYSTLGAFAALKTDGSIVVWGSAVWYGGTDPGITGGVVAVYSNYYAFAALKTDGSVVAWGDSDSGGLTPGTVSSGVVSIYSTNNAFAALKSDGSVVAWGDSDGGGTTPGTVSSGVVAVYSTAGAFAALKTDGSIVAWGDSYSGGLAPSTVSAADSGVVAVYSNPAAFVALKTDGSVVAWGDAVWYGGTDPGITGGVVAVYSNNIGSFAALKSDGSVVAWGNSSFGGTTPGNVSSGVVAVYSNENAFAALKIDGSVVAWGAVWAGGASPGTVSSGVVAVYSTQYAFAALKTDGSVVAWGDSEFGGDSTSVASDLSSNVVAVYSTIYAFAALKSNGSVVAWGYSDRGAPSPAGVTSGVAAVYATESAFAALKTTATTFDLSAAYYTDMDRYDILRKKENRRRVNLTTLNNNVFTLSGTRNLQVINPNIPSDKTLRIIVPDYTESSYSITSAATIPSDAGSVIIACDEGEPVTISGTTYVNYGSYVYKCEANNTYTKLTTEQTISGTSYTMYGGDGINSSGIALISSTPPPPPETIILTLTGSVETFSEGSERRLAFVSILASTLSIPESQIVIISVRSGSIIIELEFVQISSSDVSPVEAALRLNAAMVGGRLESIGAISLSIGGRVTTPPPPPTVKAGIMPPHLYPASSDSMFSTGRNTFARTSVPANAATITAAEATKRKQIYDPHNASSRMERLKMQAIGQSSMRVKPGEELRFKAPNVNDARDAVRRMRSGGYVAPAKSRA